MSKPGQAIVTPLLLALALGCLKPIDVETPRDAARVGIGFTVMPEGVLVRTVVPGMGADRAGIQPGDLIVAVDGAPLLGDGTVVDGDGAIRRRLTGPADVSVVLSVHGSLGGLVRQVTVQRGLPRTHVGGVSPVPAVVSEFRTALRHRGPRAARRATWHLLESDFSGLRPSVAVGPRLRIAYRNQPDVARAVAEALLPAVGRDPLLDLALGGAFFQLEDFDQVATLLASVEAARHADVQGPGWRGDAGGNDSSRRRLATSLWTLGRRDDALAVARELLRTRDGGSLLGQLGMAPSAPPDEWRAQLPPAPGVDLRLLDGTAWSLAEQRGRVVVLNFWATWCGPCRDELPELNRLAARLGDRGLTVLAISVDDESEAEPVRRMADRLALTVPVAHDRRFIGPYGVGGVPAVRVVGRDGTLRYRGSGYSPASLARLVDAVERALDDDGAGGGILGHKGGDAPAGLVSWLPEGDVRDVAVGGDVMVVGIDGRPPVASSMGRTTESLPQGPPPSDRVAWLDGAVAADIGAHWIRAWDDAGEARWFVTTPEPIVDLSSDGAHLWVATQRELLALTSDGQIAGRHDIDAHDVTGDPAGGTWAVDGERLWHVTLDGAVDRGPALDARRVSAGGWTAGEVARDLVVGRFGPAGEPRAVIARDDGVVVGLDGEGHPVFTLALADEARLDAIDTDGDGRDELLIAAPGQGLATIRLVLD